MSSIHYKFRSAVDYKTLTFDGLHISVGELKRLIYDNEKINNASADFDLQICNASTKIPYDDDLCLVSRNSSVIIARVPAAKQQRLPKVWDKSTEGVANRGKTADIYGRSLNASSVMFEKEEWARRTDLSEEEKLRAMERQSTNAYDPSNYVKRKLISGQAPTNYVCNRCHQAGHWISECPMLTVKRTTGIPRDELIETTPDDPQAMLTAKGTYVVPILHKAAKLIGKKERAPFIDDDDSDSLAGVNSGVAVPQELLCKLCGDLLRDAVLIKCCCMSFCDDCVRSRLLDSDNHECPYCHKTHVDPDSLLPNSQLRQAVNNFRNETGYLHLIHRVGSGQTSSTRYATLPPHLKQAYNDQPFYKSSPATALEPPLLQSCSTSQISSATSSYAQILPTVNLTSSLSKHSDPMVVPPYPFASGALPTPSVSQQPAIPIAVPVRSQQQQPVGPPTVVYHSVVGTDINSQPLNIPQTLEPTTSIVGTPVGATATTGSHSISSSTASPYTPAQPVVHHQPPPPGVPGAIGGVVQYAQTTPTSLPPALRPLTEEEFYLEKQRLLRSIKPKDEWEEFLKRKDRNKKKEASSSSGSRSSSASDSSFSRSSESSRSRSRSLRRRSPPSTKKLLPPTSKSSSKRRRTLRDDAAADRRRSESSGGDRRGRHHATTRSSDHHHHRRRRPLTVDDRKKSSTTTGGRHRHRRQQSPGDHSPSRQRRGGERRSRRSYSRSPLRRSSRSPSFRFVQPSTYFPAHRSFGGMGRMEHHVTGGGSSYASSTAYAAAMAPVFPPSHPWANGAAPVIHTTTVHHHHAVAANPTVETGLYPPGVDDLVKYERPISLKESGANRSNLYQAKNLSDRTKHSLSSKTDRKVRHGNNDSSPTRQSLKKYKRPSSRERGSDKKSSTSSGRKEKDRKEKAEKQILLFDEQPKEEFNQPPEHDFESSERGEENYQFATKLESPVSRTENTEIKEGASTPAVKRVPIGSNRRKVIRGSGLTAALIAKKSAAARPFVKSRRIAIELKTASSNLVDQSKSSLSDTEAQLNPNDDDDDDDQNDNDGETFRRSADHSPKSGEKQFDAGPRNIVPRQAPPTPAAGSFSSPDIIFKPLEIRICNESGEKIPANLKVTVSRCEEDDSNNLNVENEQHNTIELQDTLDSSDENDRPPIDDDDDQEEMGGVKKKSKKAKRKHKKKHRRKHRDDDVGDESKQETTEESPRKRHRKHRKKHKSKKSKTKLASQSSNEEDNIQPSSTEIEPQESQFDVHKIKDLRRVIDDKRVRSNR